ncbi:imm11 family protein [Teredinibacter sp. KSP-S5-2]|uniref:imm11 family protein n=1 Tax=Teredinibacter sp. KSP-S5-2 TaxID=3034506 RepID=UPI0029342BD3|nr:DUF1629 domain-containing protein [Teredinibacter sp. KSP-S5-2]WNO08087.1 hypothetical protein P5V12_13980 [Teredinibacter sp. KSP-S5-2]
MKYWVIFACSASDAARLAFIPKAGPKAYKYDKGIPLIDACPAQEDMTMSYDSDYPDGIKLYDIAYCIDGVIVANKKVKECLDNLGETNVEYLPVTLLNHKKDVSSTEYFILNPLGGEDIIDMDKSEYRMSALNETQIARVKHLVVNQNGVSESAKFFRAKNKGDSYFVSDEVKIAFEEAGVSGYELFEAEGWDGLNV